MQKNDILLLLILYFSAVLIKFLLSPLIPCPTILFDEIIYLEMGYGDLLFNQIGHYPLLYPFLISLFPSDSIQTSYLIGKNLNIFVSSLIIFPTYFLSRFFLDKQISLIIGFFSLLIPIGFTYSFLIMSENLFYPLFMVSVYLLFKSEKENKKWLYGISGVIIGFAVLTRLIGLVLITGFVFYIFYKYIFYRKYEANQTYAIITFLIIIFPWYFLKGISYELSKQGTFGFISLPFEHAKYNILDTLFIANSHFIYLILGVGVILGLLSIVELYCVVKNKERTLFGNFTVFSWLCAICTIIVSAVFLSGEYSVVSRYVAFLIPLFLVIGFKSIDRWNNTKKKPFIVVTLLIFFLSLFLLSIHGNETEILKCYSNAYLLTFENILLFEFLIILIFVPILFFFKINIKKRKVIVKYILISFICSLLVLGTMNDFNSRSLSAQKSFDNDAIGKYLASHNGSVVYDEDTYKVLKTYFWNLRFWCSKEVTIGNISSDNRFFVSSRNLPYPIIAQQELYHRKNTILYLYEVGKENDNNRN